MRKRTSTDWIILIASGFMFFFAMTGGERFALALICAGMVYIGSYIHLAIGKIQQSMDRIHESSEQN